MILLPRRTLLAGAAALALLPRLTRAQDTVVRHKKVSSPLVTGLVAYWPMDETSGNRLDVVGGHTLTDIGSTPSVAGKVGNAASFNGSTQYFGTPHTADLTMDGNASFSLACWIYPTTTTAAFVLCKGTSTGGPGLGEYALVTFTSYRYVLLNNDVPATPQLDVSGLTTNTWHFVCATYNGTTMSLSIDNGTPATQAYNTGCWNGSKNIGIGAGSGGASPFAGYIDEVGIWKNYVLTSTDRSTLYNGGAGKTYPFT